MIGYDHDDHGDMERRQHDTTRLRPKVPKFWGKTPMDHGWSMYGYGRGHSKPNINAHTQEVTI